MKRFLESIVAAALIGMSGCGKTEQKEQPVNYVTVNFKPVSVSYVIDYHGGMYCLFSYGTVDGEPLLAFFNPPYWQYGKQNSRRIAYMAALIQGEVDDKDNETVELTGTDYDNGEFGIKKVKANGFEMDFQ